MVTLGTFASVCNNVPAFPLVGGLPLGGTYFVDGVAQTVFNAVNYAPGVHVIVYQYTNSFGCTRTATQNITVFPLPVSNYVITSSNAQCQLGNQFTFTNNSTGAATYHWNFGDGTFATTVNATKSYTLPGIYVITLTATTSSGCQSVFIRTVTAYPQPPKPTVVPVFGNGIRSSVIASNYLWFRNNTPINGSNSLFYYPQLSGHFQVQVTTLFGCSAKSDSLFYIPERFFNAGVDEQFVFVYPKPVKGDFINVHFNLPTAHQVAWTLNTASGQLLESGTIPPNTRTYNINVKRYPSGAYVLKLTDNFDLVRGIIVPIQR